MMSNILKKRLSTSIKSELNDKDNVFADSWDSDSMKSRSADKLTKLGSNKSSSFLNKKNYKPKGI